MRRLCQGERSRRVERERSRRAERERIRVVEPERIDGRGGGISGSLIATRVPDRAAEAVVAAMGPRPPGLRRRDPERRRADRARVAA